MKWVKGEKMVGKKSIVAILVVLVILLCGCSGCLEQETVPTLSDKIVGTWCNDEVEYTFYSDGTYKYKEYLGESVLDHEEGYWEFNNDSLLRLKIVKGDYARWKGTFVLFDVQIGSYLGEEALLIEQIPQYPYQVLLNRC